MNFPKNFTCSSHKPSHTQNQVTPHYLIRLSLHANELVENLLMTNNIAYITGSFQNGADVNARNGMGDTSLHRAAFTGRAVSYALHVFQL